MVSRLSPGLPSQNATLWGTPMTPQSPRRSPHRWLHNSCSRPPKTRRLWHNTNNNPARAPHKRTMLPLHHLRPLRGGHDWVYLPPPDRSKIPNRLLIRRPHRPGCCWHPHSNPMRFFRGPHSHNCPRTHIIRPLLPSKHKLRTNTHPNNSPSPRSSSCPPFNNLLMIHRQSS